MQKLTPRDLTAGMVLAESVKTPSGQVLAIAGEVLTRQSINKMKLYNIQFAVVEGAPKPVAEEAPVPMQKKVAKVLGPIETPAPRPPEAKTRIEEAKTNSQKVMESDEFRSFQLDYFKAIEYLKEVFAGVLTSNKPIDEKKLIASVEPLFLSRNTITELFDMLHNMRSINDSVYAHCINVALISRMIGRWLHLEQHDLDILICCGLLHDIGKLCIPEEILNKPGKLTDEEFDLIKTHPKKGYELLKNQSLDSRIKRSALMHHERYDGSGYPNGLEGDVLSDFAMIVAIADVYDAMTAARSYRVPLCPFQVIANFEKEGFQKYHTKYIYVFLKRIATTYQSNRVMLNDARGCKIVMLNQNSLSRPIVQFDNGECLDLSKEKDLYITAVL